MATDGEWVQASLNGRKEAFGDLVRKYASSLMAVCASRVSSRAEAEDLVQEVFLRAYEGLSSLKEPEKFWTWVYGIAVRVCADWIGRRQRDRSRPHEVESALNAEDGGSDAASLMKAVDELPEPYRETLILFHMEKKSYQEISELLKITPAGVNQRLTRARAQLRERLARSVP